MIKIDLLQAKSCSTCLKSKPIVDFYLQSVRGGKPLPRPECKTCQQKTNTADRRNRYQTEPEFRARSLATSAAFWSRNHEYRRKTFATRLKVTLGIDLETLGWMLHSQNFSCAICQTALKFDKFTHIDHDHETNRVRGILCHHCNTAVGLFRDSPELMRRAMEYLHGQ